jgi:hypothetical protein
MNDRISEPNVIGAYGRYHNFHTLTSCQREYRQPPGKD